MKRLAIYSLLFVSLFTIATRVFADPNPIVVSVKTTGTTAVVTATCATCYGYVGNIEVSDGVFPGDGGFLKSKQVFFSQNVPVVFTVTGLKKGKTYYAKAGAYSDASSWKGVQSFSIQQSSQTTTTNNTQTTTTTTQTTTNTTQTSTNAQQSGTQSVAPEGDPTTGDGTCGDQKDNDGDGRIDYDGVGGTYEPDPSCYLGKGASEVAKGDEKSGLIACNNYCTFSDVLKTINNLIVFLITVLFVPIIIIMFMYAGFKYLTAQGDPKKIINLKSLLKHIFIGILIVLSAWLIVKVLLIVLVKDTDSALQFLEK